MPFPVGSSAPRSSNMVFDGDLRVPAGFKLVTPQIDALSSTIDVNAVQVNANTELQVTEGNLLFVDNIQAVGSNGIDIDYSNPVMIYLNPVGDSSIVRQQLTPTDDITLGSDFNITSIIFKIPTTISAGTISFSGINGCYYDLVSGTQAIRNTTFTTTVTSNLGVVGSTSYNGSTGGTSFRLFFPSLDTLDIAAGTHTITVSFTAHQTSGSTASAIYRPRGYPIYSVGYRDIVANYKLNL